MVYPDEGEDSNVKGTNVRISAGEILITDAEESSVDRVRNEVQTIIDIMGPGTPVINTTSTTPTTVEADNEDSTYTDTKTTTKTTESIPSIRKESKKCKFKCDPPCKRHKQTQATDSDKTEPPTDISLREDTVKENTLSVEFESPILTDVASSKEYDPYNTIMCPRPIIGPNGLNSECMCPQVADYFKQGPYSQPYFPEVPYPTRNHTPKRENSPILTWFKNLIKGPVKKKRKAHLHQNQEYYKMDVKDTSSRDGKRIVFELVDDAPTRKSSKDEKNISNKAKLSSELKQYSSNVTRKQTGNVNVEKELKEPIHRVGSSDRGKTRVDVYYFDHGNSTYFRTTDRAPLNASEILAEKTEAYTAEFWAGVFGTIHIGFSFITSFILQFFRFILYSIVRPLTIGIIQLASDYFFKPCLATVFNGVVQPILIFFYNVATSVRDLCDPIAEGLGYFIREIAQLFKACRLVEINKECAERRCNRDACRACNKRTTC